MKVSAGALATFGVAAWAVVLSVLLGSFANRGDSVDLPVTKPQEPQRPFPYAERQVELTSGGLRRAGTLTLPRGDGPFPAVLLISGAGAQDRDGTIGGHKRFLLLADRLTRAGIAVLRTDDRGVGGSQGDLLHATLQDLAADARSAVDFLAAEPRVDANAIGALGGSQGTQVASLAASGNERLAFLVLMSPPGLPGAELLVDQQVRLARASGAGDQALKRVRAITREIVDLAMRGEGGVAVRQRLESLYLKLVAELPLEPGLRLHSLRQEASQRVQHLLSPSMLSDLRYEPAVVLSTLTQPVLVIGGDLDQQTAPEVNFPPIQRAFEATGVDATLRRFPGLNHLLQPADTGLPTEYGSLAITIDEAVLEEIIAWILQRFPSPHPIP